MQYPFHVWEILLYEVVTVFFYFLPVLPVFGSKRRFSWKITIIVAILTAAVNIFGNAVILFGNSFFYAFADVFFGILYYLVMLLLFKDNPGRILFFLLAVADLSNLVVIGGKYMESQLFGSEVALMRYHYTFSLSMIPVAIVVYAALWFTVFSNLRDTVRKGGPGDALWKFNWLVPAVFFLFWMEYFYNSSVPVSVRSQQKGFVLFEMAMDAGFMFMMYLQVRMVKEQNVLFMTQEDNLLKDMELQQFETIHQQIDSMRKLRHDFRHHFTYLQYSLERQDTEDALRYIEQVTQSYALSANVHYSDHQAVNAILGYYDRYFERAGIPHEFQAGIPTKLGVSDTDMTVLLGNLLQNAYDACMRTADPSKAFAEMRIRMATDRAMTIVCRNSSEEAPEQLSKGRYKSHNHSGEGVGTISIQNIVRHYSGTMQVQWKDQIYSVSILVSV